MLRKWVWGSEELEHGQRYLVIHGPAMTSGTPDSAPYKKAQGGLSPKATHIPPSQPTNHHHRNPARDPMAPKHTKQSKKKPALKDLSAFENSRQLTSIMRDALVGKPPSLVGEGGGCSANHIAALSARSEHEAPGFSASPDLIKIDPRNGQGLLMDYDVSLNMKAELTMVREGDSASACVDQFRISSHSRIAGDQWKKSPIT